MPIFYRGAAMGTYYHDRDARLEGFVARMPSAETTSDLLIGHVARGTTNSPYVSLTRSFGVARSYALANRKPHVLQKQGLVYVLELDKRSGVELFDPVKQMARLLGSPYDDPSYHHDGAPNFILGVADPARNWVARKRYIDQPPPGLGTPRPANLHHHFETLIRSLRDAEILAVRAIPKKYVMDCVEVN
jgi:hypothetical protein